MQLRARRSLLAAHNNKCRLMGIRTCNNTQRQVGQLLGFCVTDDRKKLTAILEECAAHLAAGDFAAFHKAHARIGFEAGVDHRAITPTPEMLAAPAPDVTPLFIAGLHRSGTSLLENHIAHRFDVAYLRARVPQNEGQHLEAVTRSEVAFGGPGMFGFDGAMRMAKIDDTASAREMAGNMLKAWAPYMVGDSRVLLEKSPPNLTRLPFLKSLFPQSKFVIVARDPRAVAMATKKWAKTAIRDMMLHWHVCYSEAMKALDDTCMIVKYEDFCADPTASLKRIGDHAGLLERSHSASDLTPPATPENGNAKYLEDYEAGNFPRYPTAAWHFFGYQV